MTDMKGFLESEIGRQKPEDCLFHVIPVPFEATVSYGGGTAQGPAAILEASGQLEVWDGHGIPADRGIFTHRPVDCDSETESVLDRIEAAVSQVLDWGKLPVLLGGEHTVTLGALRAVRKHHGRIGVIQFDAHADLRNTYEGSPYSHACVMHRALDLGLAIFQIGVRALSPPEVQLRKERGIGCLDAEILGNAGGVPDIILPDGFPKTVYLTFDVDGLDPSVVPATGTPEPGGLTWWQTMSILQKVIRGRYVAGMDVVELAPVKGQHASDFAAARLTYNLMGLILRHGLSA